MNFNLTNEQQQFVDSLERWLQKNYGFEQRKATIQQADSSAEQWRSLADLGVFMLTAPQVADGYDGNAIDVMATMQTLGKYLVVAPVLDTFIALDLLRQHPESNELISEIASGNHQISIAFFERESRYDPAYIALQATPDGDEYLLSGEKTIVSHNEDTDSLIIAARCSGRPGDKNGITLFLVPLDADGITVNAYHRVDGFRAADIQLDRVRVPTTAALHPVGAGWPLLERAVDLGTLGVCAEGLGVMQSLNEATVEYMKTRQQFGVYLGQFQALQHRCVEMLMQYRQARVLTMLAAENLQSDDLSERRRTISAAKTRVNQALRFIGQEAVHLHGGIGVTNELPVAHFFKRATVITKTWGDLDHHLARFIAEPGFTAQAKVQPQVRQLETVTA